MIPPLADTGILQQNQGLAIKKLLKLKDYKFSTCIKEMHRRTNGNNAADVKERTFS